jgi:hypothetical protein
MERARGTDLYRQRGAVMPSRNEALEEAARLIEEHMEVTLSATIAGMQYVVSRKEGCVAGLSYARAIRALKTPAGRGDG